MREGQPMFSSVARAELDVNAIDGRAGHDALRAQAH
jgi:hypothetical protein